MSIILKFRLLEAYEYDMMHHHSPAAATPKSQNDQMKVKEDFNQKMQLIFFFSELDFELNRAKKNSKKISWIFLIWRKLGFHVKVLD